jgi:nucleoside-diphosphate-sugar epimerase
MLFEWADEGRNFPVLGSGNVRTQMLDVSDLVEALLATLTLPAEQVNANFNIAATEYGTLREDFQSVLDAAGHGKRVIGLPVRPAVVVLEALNRAGWSPVYSRLIHKLLADSAASTRVAEERLGFSPRYSNRDAILRTYEWWRSCGGTGRVAGRTSHAPWKQGVLAAAKVFF